MLFHATPSSLSYLSLLLCLTWTTFTTASPVSGSGRTALEKRMMNYELFCAGPLPDADRFPPPWSRAQFSSLTDVCDVDSSGCECDNTGVLFCAPPGNDQTDLYDVFSEAECQVCACRRINPRTPVRPVHHRPQWQPTTPLTPMCHVAGASCDGVSQRCNSPQRGDSCYCGTKINLAANHNNMGVFGALARGVQTSCITGGLLRKRDGDDLIDTPLDRRDPQGVQGTPTEALKPTQSSAAPAAASPSIAGAVQLLETETIACPCNCTYVSESCCFAKGPQKIVHEEPAKKLGYIAQAGECCDSSSGKMISGLADQNGLCGASARQGGDCIAC
ncbi:MAG: hypothetical protein M1817_004329 [Caeruleum heppii]|nr:MAG: hypothetical protein M1817_004329 [Caeruleum heppii]